MSNDVFQHWKENRFIIAPNELVDNEKLVILIDHTYWVHHGTELFEWCSERNATTQGMTVVFGDEVTLLEFVLKWS